ncbi:uncharacterized protein LOC117100027 [Anneissia japonica]|uniref:uncharacterized protein LOC117100027 n=1 Tax=Anneissia japonica TaxID=1529436 RepID=UPI0014259AE5|nr:uncharacterized protein LOC117100027 [Anneissia japonica]
MNVDTDMGTNTPSLDYSITPDPTANNKATVIPSGNTNTPMSTIKVMEYFAEFEDRVLSNVNHIKGLQNKTEYFDGKNYIGFAKIESTNGIQWINNNLQVADETKVEFALQVQTEIKGNVIHYSDCYFHNYK